jgi:uncharacterized protein YfiM (DUF2279 family)
MEPPFRPDAQTPLPAPPRLPEPLTEPQGALGPFNDLLAQPLAVVYRARQGMRFAPFRLLAGALVCCALYGAAAGFFAGGSQVLVTALKAPLIVALSLLLCAPSLYVFSALAGVRWSWRGYLAVVAGFAGTLGLLLAGLLPIAWLFSLSSRYLLAVTWIHVLLWVLALLVGWRFLSRALAANGAQSGMFLWLVLFCAVSFQVATFLRPVLWHERGAPLFRLGEKMSFLEHLGKASEWDQKRDEEQRKAEQKKAEEEEKKKAEEAKKKAAAPAAR